MGLLPTGRLLHHQHQRLTLADVWVVQLSLWVLVVVGDTLLTVAPLGVVGTIITYTTRHKACCLVHLLVKVAHGCVVVAVTL